MEILNKENLNAVLASNETIIIDFFADWCTSCKILMPKVEKISLQYKDSNVKFFKANVEEMGEFAKSKGIRNLPCLLIMKGNEVVSRQIGDKPFETVDEFIKTGI